MTQEQIIQNNKLIAEFMGGIYQSDNFRIDEGYIWLPYHNMQLIIYLKYHTSWDWLMPVVEKIESLGYRTMCEGTAFYITKYPVDYFNTNIQIGDDDVIGKEHFGIKEYQFDKKENTYNAVIDFINWYNQQPKP